MNGSAVSEMEDDDLAGSSQEVADALLNERVQPLFDRRLLSSDHVNPKTMGIRPVNKVAQGQSDIISLMT